MISAGFQKHETGLLINTLLEVCHMNDFSTCIPAETNRNFGKSFRQFVRTIVAAALFVTVLPADAQAAKGNRFLPAVMAIAAPTGAQNLCNKYDWVCSTSRQKRRFTKNDSQLIASINRRVNRQTREITDQAQYKVADNWSLPTSRGGDCEDFALLKKRELVRAGISPDRLLLATVLDRRRNSHAVLVLRTDTGDYVLDNLTNKIMSWQSTRYTFLRMQDPRAPRRWVGVLAGG